MALFVHPDLTVLRDSIRTFRRFLWAEMPGAARPRDRHSGAPWHTDETWQTLRLSSRSHWDVPVRTAEGTVLHVLASHPAVPTRDGAAQRSDRRNHDEIRFWVDYLDDASYIEDDSGRGGGLDRKAAFVIVGRLNADPADDNVFRAAVHRLLSHDRIRDPRPTASAGGQSAFASLTAEATARWGGRVDYVLPSNRFVVDTSGVWRPVSDTAAVPVSDHFPVWVDLRRPKASLLNIPLE
jgi:endonuclease/exonuclease/phosphatase family metal-dependent hydrolase